MAEAQALFADELAPSAAGSPVGVVGVIDESAFTKKGAHSAGVARQHNGRLGKEDNCQVGVFLISVAPAGSARLDHRLFLPESWCAPTREARRRRDGAHIPEDVTFRTKQGTAQIAVEISFKVGAADLLPISWSSDNGSHLFVDSGDEGSGRSSSIGTYPTQVAANAAGV
jgi:SRSO17 transposase